MDDPYILTYTGRVFHFDLTTPDDICIEDIAHALSQLCRYTGHTNMFYSVAQHSLLVAEKIPGNAETKLAALLHDAAEAYIGDVSSPLKRWMKQKDDWAYDSLDHAITAAIHRRYGITHIPDDVRLYDQAVQIFEAEAFLGLCPPTPKDLEIYNFPMELRGLWLPWDPIKFAGRNVDVDFGQVETEFLRRFEVLMSAVGRRELI